MSDLVTIELKKFSIHQNQRSTFLNNIFVFVFYSMHPKANLTSRTTLVGRVYSHDCWIIKNTKNQVVSIISSSIS
jgi:hypothetical protein